MLIPPSITIGETKVQGWVPDTQGGQPEYCIFYGVSESGTVGFYRYDLTDKTIQRYFEQSADGNTQTLELQDVTDRYNSLVDDYNIARIALGAVAAVAVILLILLILSRRGRGRREEDPYDAYAQLDEKPEKKEKKAKKESRKNGRKLSREERYMMGEEDDYEDDYEPEQEPDEEEPEDDELEIQDAQEYIPDPAQEADAQLDQVKKQLAASLAEDPEQAEKHEKEAPKAETKPEDDDFEVFDLDDEL